MFSLTLFKVVVSVVSSPVSIHLSNVYPLMEGAVSTFAAIPQFTICVAPICVVPSASKNFTVYVFIFHLAYNVRFFVTVSVLKFHALLHPASLYQPPKVYTNLTGADGRVTNSPSGTVIVT